MSAVTINGLSEDESLIVSITYNLSGLLSFFASFIMLSLLSGVIIKNCRKFDLISMYCNIILIFLSFTDMITGGLYMISWIHPQRDIICDIGATLRQISQPSSVFWVDAIYLTLYYVYNRRRILFSTAEQLRKHLMIFLVIFPLVCWGIPTTIALMLYFLNAYESIGYWCWTTDPFYQILFFFLPIFIGFLFAIVFSILIARKRNLSNLSSIVLDMIWYIPGFLVIWTIPSINGAVLLFTHGKHYFLLDFGTALTLPLQGFVNFIIWGIIIRIRRYNIEESDMYSSSDTDLEEHVAKGSDLVKIMFFGRPLLLPNNSTKNSYYTSEFE